jgi:hypothetical protein
MLHYYATEQSEQGMWRAGAHTDFDCQAALAGALEQQRQAVEIGMRTGAPHPLLRLFGGQH